MIYLDDSEFTHRHSSIQRFTKLSEQEQSILEEVRGTMKCILCSKSSSKSYDKLIKLMKYGHAVCKEYFKTSKNQRCQQDNYNKAIDRKEFDKFQIIAVMEAKYDVELIKALECVACFEIFNLAANNPRLLNHCSHTIGSSCIEIVFKCPQCRKSFFHPQFKENKALIKFSQLQYFLTY